MTPEPQSACQPASWSFGDIRAATDGGGQPHYGKGSGAAGPDSGNPGLRGQSKITTDLYAGVQLVLPGEWRPSTDTRKAHCVSCWKAPGAHTSVAGERTIMNEGDLIITPPMAWHDHGNTSEQPVFWLDGPDIPLVQFLDASFSEHLDEDEQPITRPTGDSEARFGANLLPVDYKRGDGNSPVFNYPHLRTRDALERMRRAEEWDACHGLKMRYTNPATGGYAMTTIGTFVQLLPKGFSTVIYRSTDATVFVSMEGRGRTHIGDDFTVDWQSRDILLFRAGKPSGHEAAEESVSFSFSDRPVQEALHLFREKREK